MKPVSIAAIAGKVDSVLNAITHDEIESTNPVNFMMP